MINSNALSRSIRQYLPAASRLPKLCGEKPSVAALVHCSVRSPVSQPWTYPWFRLALCRPCAFFLCLPLFVRSLSVLRTEDEGWYHLYSQNRTAIVEFTKHMLLKIGQRYLIWLKLLPNQRTVFAPSTGSADLIVNLFYFVLVRKPRLGRLRRHVCFGKVKVCDLYRRRWLHYEVAAAVFRLFSEGAAVASAMELLPVCSCRVRSRLSNSLLLDSCAA